VSQAQSSRIPLTLKQRFVLTVVFLLALMLSYCVVSAIDPLASRLRLLSAIGVHPGELFAGGLKLSDRAP